MLEYYCRQKYQYWLVDGVANVIGRYLSPTHITLFAGLAGLASLLFLINGSSLLAIFLLLISGYADTLDGTVARNYGTSSPVGSVLDIMTDRAVEFGIIFGLFLLDPTSRGLMCMLMLGSVLLCVTSFLVVGIFTQNESDKGFNYTSGLMERAEAFMFFILMIIFPSYFTSLSAIFVALVLLTTCIRIFEFSRYING
jgi:phosphatidylglycerophosphate synthase